MIIIEKRLSAFYKLFQSLSLDVVIGVLAVSLFASKLLNVEANPIWLLIISMATWSFYTIDHLIDGFKVKGNSTIFRHSFHYKYRIALLIISFIAGSIAVILGIIYLDYEIIKLGLGFGFIVLIYFTAIYFITNKKTFLLQKELIIACIYIAGIWLAPLVWHQKMPEIFIIIVISVLFLLAWAEGIMASWFDYENDLKENHSSFTILFGKSNTRRFLIVFHILIFILIKLSVFFVSSNINFAAMIILALMNLSLLLIILYPSTFSKNDKYRIFGEMVFWLPFLILLADLF